MTPESPHLKRATTTEHPEEHPVLPETPAELKKAIVTLEAGRDLNDIPTDELRTLNALYEKLDALVSPETPALSATYHRPQEDGTTTPEVIELSLEASLSSFESFYTTHHLDLPPDFKERMEDIWNRNRSEMEKAIEQYGFDTLLLVPGGTALPDLHTKMTEGYNHTFEGGNFKTGGSFAGVSEDTSKDRIILVHKAQELNLHPALNDTLNKAAQTFLDQHESLTLSDYLIFQRKHFDETGQHLDEKEWTWLPGSRSGTPVVLAYWRPDGGRLGVNADGPSNRSSNRGCRLSRCFV